MTKTDIFLIENHNEALSLWRGLSLQNKTLVHIDRHFDFARISDKEPSEILAVKSFFELKKAAEKEPLWNLSRKTKDELVHIGNYIEPAIKEGIVNRFYWVVPDFLCNTPKQIRRLRYEICQMLLRGFKEKVEIVVAGTTLTAQIGEVPLTICAIKDLPQLQEDVLLDIDVDYFIHNNTLWNSVEEFVNLVKQKLHSQVITIAYSVEEGFTPIEYKCMGDYLANLFDNNSHTNGYFKEAIGCILNAIDAKRKKIYPDAESFLKQALGYCPDYAAIQYHLSMLYYEMGLKDAARDYYHQAVIKDTSYRTLYNNWGPILEDSSKLHQARLEYEKMIELDPQNFNYYVRLGNIASNSRNLEEALKNYNKALEINPESEEALTGRANILLKKRKWDESFKNLNQALSLKPHSPFAHYLAGVIYMKTKRYNQAMRHLRQAINNGFFTVPGLRWRLVFIYLKNKIYNRMFDELKNAFITSYYYVRERIRWLPG